MPIDSMLVELGYFKMEQEFFMNIEELGITSIEVALYWGSQLIRVKSVSMNEEFTLENGQKLARIEKGRLVFYENTKLNATLFSNGKSQNVIPNDFSQKGLLLKHGHAIQLESGEFCFHINTRLSSQVAPRETNLSKNIFIMFSLTFITLLLMYLILN